MIVGGEKALLIKKHVYSNYIPNYISHCKLYSILYYITYSVKFY